MILNKNRQKQILKMGFLSEKQFLPTHTIKPKRVTGRVYTSNAKRINSIGRTWPDSTCALRLSRCT